MSKTRSPSPTRNFFSLPNIVNSPDSIAMISRPKLIEESESSTNLVIKALHLVNCHSQSSALPLLLAPTPSGECNVENGRYPPPLPGSRSREELEVNETTTNCSLEMPAIPRATTTTSHISNSTNGLCSQFNNLVKWSSVSHGLPVHGERPTGFRPNQEPTILPWHSRTLASFTWYGELSVACTPEEFASVRTKLQQEWSLNGNFLVGLAAVNVTILAITPDSSFKIDPHCAHITIATSSAACSLGIACNVWFLLRYDWVNLKTFIYRSRDVYDSYISFSLSSRMPTFCMVVSSISLMAFLLLVAFDASPVCVLVIGTLVILVMTVQFIVYGVHQVAASALRVWKAGAISTVNFIKHFQGFRRGG